MFSIIDNEIKVNFEILGGTSTPVISPVVGAVTGTTPPDSSAAKKALTETILSQVLAIFRTKYPDVFDKFGEIGNAWTSFEDPDFAIDEDMYKRAIGNMPTDAPITGGNFDDALFKDIKLNLIGGLNMTESRLFSALIRWIFTSTNPKVQELKKAMLKYKSDAKEALSDYEQFDLTGESVKFSNITQRVNNKLQVKDGDDYKSLEDYWNGMTQSKFAAEDAFYGAAIGCFYTYSPIFKDDGKVNNQLCLDYIKNKDKWKVGVADIQKIHPVVAFNLLKSLGFKGIKSSNGLVKVQSYSSWLNDLNKESKKALENSSGKIENDQLIKNIIAFVNANPSILNLGDIPETAGKDMYGVQPALFNETFDKERKLVQDKMLLLRSRLFGLTGDTIFEVAQSGGGYRFPSRSYNRIENFPIFSKQLRTIYTNLQSRLKSYQKTLGETTKQKIEEIFSNLEKHENEAKELIKRLEYYYIDIKANNNKVGEILTDEALNNAKKNLNKNLNKIAGRSTSILDIEQVINTAVMDSKSFELPAAIQ